MDIQKCIKNSVRAQFVVLATLLNRYFGKWITPDGITYFGFFAHIPIAILIAQDHLVVAGILLIFFGLFDTLDGALARVQGVASPQGMFLDASTDRLKEMIIYTGLVYLFVDNDYALWAPVAAVFACGLSLSVSYVKAKGEAALASSGARISHEKLNRIFDDGLGSFEIRMALLVVGCIVGSPQYAIAIIILIVMPTIVKRMQAVTKALAA